MSLAAPAAETDAAEDAVGDEPPAGPLARITAVEIENLRGIRTGKLEGLAPLTVLTGPNGSGKSTVLDALDIGGSRDVTGALWDCVQRRPAMPLGALWIYRDGRDRCPIIRVRGRVEGDWRTVQLPLAYPADRRPFAVAVGIFDGYMTMSDKLTGENTVQYVVEFGQGQLRPKRGGAFHLADVSEVKVVQGLTIGSGASAEAYALFSAARREGRAGAALSHAQALFPGVTALSSHDEGDGSFLVLEWPGRVVPAAVGGDGAYAALRLGMEMLTSSGIILLEEPEAHLHPAAMVLVARAIVNAVRAGTQVVLTTHSIEFLDCLLDESEGEPDDFLALFRVHLREGELTSVRHAGPDVRFVREEVAKDLR